jgi:hypothetical protein
MGTSRAVVLADGKHDLWDLVDGCMSVWETFVAIRLIAR